MVNYYFPLLLYLINNHYNPPYVYVLNQTMNKLYVKMFSKHYSNVCMIDFIMQAVDYGVSNLVEPP